MYKEALFYAYDITTIAFTQHDDEMNNRYEE